MPVRLGVELSSTACRLVELEPGLPFDRQLASTRVRAFSRLPRESVGTRQRPSAFRRPPAAAVVWGLQADHHHVTVEHGSFRRMRRDAVAAMQAAGIDTRGRVADIFAARRVKGSTARSVVVALASTPGLATATRWLAAEGLHVQSIVTPALALMSLARLRRALAVPDRIEAYIALEETTTAVALLRNGLLLAAGELAWGYQDERGLMLAREAIAMRLADELARALAARALRPDALAQVCVCGGLPELRSMAVGLTERLDVEVETLDSLFGIDAAHLPDPAQEFREHGAEFRLAWAVAADWPSPVNLLRERQRRLTKTMLSRAAVAAGVATGVGVAWQVQRSDWWRPTPAVARPVPIRPATARATSTPTRAPVAVAAPPRLTPPAAIVAARPEVVVPVARAVEPVVPIVRPPPPPPPQVRPLPPPVARAEPAPVLPPAARPLVVQPAEAAPRETVRRETPPRQALPPVRADRSPVPDRRRVAPESEIPLPFDAVLGTILYAPERKLAIIDGRIVETGDEVNGARVIDITPTTVLLRDGRGRLRRLGLGAPPAP